MIPEPFSQQLAAFPAPLRTLVEAELEAGNSIEAIEHGFPAAPCGASVKLARAVTAERRRSVGEVQFYARNNPSYAGEFTTAERHFFVLEPPLPPPTEPDSPYYRYRLGLHQRTVDAMAQTRSSQDKHDFATLAEAKVDLEYRRARRMALLDIEFERERLDLLEAEIENGGLPNLAASGHPTLTVAPTKKKVRERAR